MLKRLVLAALLVAGGFSAANGQANPQPRPSHVEKARAKAPVASPAAPTPQKEWAEQVIDKFLAIPDAIFTPPSPEKP